MKVEKKSDGVVIALQDRIDISNSQDLKQELSKLYEDGENDITLDFSSVTGIDSSGLGKLLLFQKKLKERGGKLRIVSVNSDYIKKMFTMIHLYKVIDIEGFESGSN